MSRHEQPTSSRGDDNSPQVPLSTGHHVSDEGSSRVSSTTSGLRGKTATTAQLKWKPGEPAHVDGIELHSFGFGESDDSTNVATLPLPDEGFGPWSYVAAAFAMYIVVWGFPNAFPIFQTYLSSGDKAPYPSSTVLPLLAPGLQDIIEGILFPFLPKIARYRRPLVIAGIGIIIGSMSLASYATTAWQVVLTQGLLFGTGGILLNFVHVSIFVEWFTEEKQPWAMGIIWTGYRVGELAFPLICQWLLEKHGYRQTLRVLIAPMVSLLIPSVILLRGRYPVSYVRSEPIVPARSKLDVLRSPDLLFHLLVSLMWDLVINVPTMFITTYGADVMLSPSERAFGLSLYTLSNMVGTYVLGWISTTENFEALLAVCSISTAIVHLLWGFVRTRTGLFAYAIGVGLTSGGSDNCLYPYYSEMAGGDSELFKTIHSTFSFVGGVATLSVGPIGSALLKRSPEVELGVYALGKYKWLIAYAAGTMGVNGILHLLHIKFAKRLGITS